MEPIRFYKLIHKNPQSGRGRRHYALLSTPADAMMGDPAEHYEPWAEANGYSAYFIAGRWAVFGVHEERARACLDLYFKGKPGYVVSTIAEGWPVHPKPGATTWLDPRASVQMLVPVQGCVIKINGEPYQYDGAAFVPTTIKD